MGKDLLLDYRHWLQDAQKRLQLEFRTFTASELGSITEVSPTTQRDWRRRGIERTERPSAGWNRYTFPDLAFFSTLRLLINVGVSASSAAQLADYSVFAGFQIADDATRRGQIRSSGS